MIFRPIFGSRIFGAWVREWGSDSRMTDYKSRVKFDSYHINLDRWYSTTRSPRSSWLTIRRWWTMPPGSWGPKNPGQAWRLNMLPGWNYKISSRWDCQQNEVFLPEIGRFLPILSSNGLWYYDADNSLKTGLDVAKYTATIMRKDMADYDNDST